MSRCQRAIVVAFVFTCAGLALGQDDSPEGDGAQAADVPKVVVPFYGNTLCPVSGKEAKRNTVVKAGNQRIHVCCRKCQKKASADPAAYLAKAYPDDEIVDLGNTTCPISGHEIESGVDVDWQGYRVRLCCEDCVSTFTAAPARAITLLKNPNVKELGNEECIVEPGEENEPDEFFLYGDLLIDSCCADCADEFAQKAEELLAAYRKAHPSEDEGAEEDDHDEDGDR